MGKYIRTFEFASASLEVRKPYRRFVLMALSELEAKNSGRLFPLSLIMSAEVRDGDVRNALRGLYKAGLVRGHSGNYGLTPTGRAVLRSLQLQELVDVPRAAE